jgi:hypothetical protein
MRYSLKNPLWRKRPAEARKALEMELRNRLAELEVQRLHGMDVWVEILIIKEVLGETE